MSEEATRTVIVTGAASGLGRATAERLCAHGLNVALADVNEEKLQEALKAMPQSTGRCIAVDLDVVSKSSIQRLVTAVENEFGQIHSLVHCAGVSRGPTQKGPNGWLPMEEVGEADWDYVVDIDLKGTFLVDQGVGRHMIANEYGRIVNVASMSAVVSNQKLLGHGPYNAAKAGVVALTRAFAVEWARKNVTVNAISPGYMNTALGTRSQAMIPGFREFLLERTAQGRLGEPAEFAAVAEFLASDDASHITGHNLVMDGGYTAW